MNEILEDISVRNRTLSVLLPAEIDEQVSSILRMELDRQISTKRIERIVLILRERSGWTAPDSA